MIDYATILRDAGLPVSEVSGWQTTTHPGEFTARGGMWHHTTRMNDLDFVISGSADLEGPLANLFLAQDGTFHVVCGGVAYHAGCGTLQVLEDLLNGVTPKGDAKALGLVDDTRIANHFLVGIEVEGGVDDADDFTKVQIDNLMLGSAALCRALGFDETHWIHHREWTNRKTDMSHREDLRARLRNLLADGPTGLQPRTTTTTAETTGTTTPVDPPTPPATEDVMYVVIEAPGRSPAFFTTDGQGHAMGPGGWTFINRFAVKHPNLVVFDSSWTADEYDLVVRLPVHSTDEPVAGPPLDVTLPPDLLDLPPDVPEPTVGTLNF